MFLGSCLCSCGVKICLDTVTGRPVCVQDDRWEVELQREKLRQQEDRLKVDTVY